jgi:hypothetical protein
MTKKVSQRPEYESRKRELKKRGTGTPKNKDEVNKHEGYECDGWVSDLDMMGDPSIFQMKRLLYEYRCDERLKTKNEESTRLTDTGLVCLLLNR